MKTKDILWAVCQCRVRYNHRQSGDWVVWPADEDTGERVCRELLATGRVKAGNSGWTGLPKFGMAQFVYALRIGRSIVRVLQPPIPTRGQFSGPLPASIDV